MWEDILVKRRIEEAATLTNSVIRSYEKVFDVAELGYVKGARSSQLETEDETGSFESILKHRS